MIFLRMLALWFKVVAVVFAVTAALAVIVTLLLHLLGIDIGGHERTVAVAIWLIIATVATLIAGPRDLQP